MSMIQKNNLSNTQIEYAQNALSSLTHAQYRVFRVVAEFLVNARATFVSHSYIGRRCGILRRQVIRHLNVLRARGIIGRMIRKYNSNLYMWGHLLQNPYVRASLAHVHTIFRPVCLRDTLSKQGYKEIYKYIHRRGDATLDPRYLISAFDYNYKKPIMPAMRGLQKKFALSRSEIANLHAFPQFVVEYAIHALYTTSTSVRDVGNYLMAICLRYCHIADISPSWKYTAIIAGALGSISHMQKRRRPVRPPVEGPAQSMAAFTQTAAFAQLQTDTTGKGRELVNYIHSLSSFCYTNAQRSKE